MVTGEALKLPLGISVWLSFYPITLSICLFSFLPVDLKLEKSEIRSPHLQRISIKDKLMKPTTMIEDWWGTQATTIVWTSFYPISLSICCFSFLSADLSFFNIYYEDTIPSISLHSRCWWKMSIVHLSKEEEESEIRSPFPRETLTFTALVWNVTWQ